MAYEGAKKVLEPSDAEQLRLILSTNHYPQTSFVDTLRSSWASRSFKKALLANSLVQASQYLAGLNLVAYAINIFNEASNMNPFEKLLKSSLSPILGSFMSMFIVDVKYIGRKCTLIISFASVVLCLFVLGISFTKTKVTTQVSII